MSSAATGLSHLSGAPIGPDKWTLALDFIGVECYGVLRFRRPVAGAMWPHGARSPVLVRVFCCGPGARRNIAAIWPGEAAFGRFRQVVGVRMVTEDSKRRGGGLNGVPVHVARHFTQINVVC